MSARNDEWSVLMALERAFERHNYPWEVLNDRIGFCRQEINLSNQLKLTGGQTRQTAIETLRNAFADMVHLLSDADKMRAAIILSRNSRLQKLTDLLRHSLPGGDSLLIAGTATYDAIGVGIVEETAFRVNVLPTLLSVSIESPRWVVWLKAKNLFGNGGIAARAEGHHAACARLGAVALSEHEDNTRLHFDCEEKAVLANLMI